MALEVSCNGGGSMVVESAILRSQLEGSRISLVSSTQWARIARIADYGMCKHHLKVGI